MTKVIRKRFLTPRVRNIIVGLLFCSPWILGLVIIYGGPILTSLWWSFTNYRVMNPPQWIGLSNYIELANDPVIHTSVSNSLVYAAMAIPAQVIGGIGLALLLNTKIRGRAFYRSVYYFPVLVPAVASAVVWRWVLDPQLGLANHLLRSLGLPTPGWIGSVTWAKSSMVLISIWGMGNSVIIYLASLQDVPRSLYDAAEVDGANAWQKVRHVTLPMITPVIFFNLIMGLIGAFQFFTLPYVMTTGDGTPGQSLLFYSMVLYRQAFLYLRMGYGATMAWMLFLFILIGTLIIFRSSSRWVYYGGG